MSKHIECTATTRNGTPCPNRALPGKTVCFAHDRDLNDSERRREAGRQKANVIRARKRLGIDGSPLALRQVDAALGNALAALLAGEVEAGTASAAATLARAIATVRQASEFEDRLQRLEQAAGLEAEGIVP